MRTARGAGRDPHRAPCSWRQRECEKGLSGARAEFETPADPPSHVTVPQRRPASLDLVAEARQEKHHRRDARVRDRLDNAIRRAVDRASGFSSSRWRPASAARTASSACTSGGTATDTASTLSRSASSSASAATPCRAARAAALAGSRPRSPRAPRQGVRRGPRHGKRPPSTRCRGRRSGARLRARSRTPRARARLRPRARCARPPPRARARPRRARW